jgi:hypothetical protein
MTPGRLQRAPLRLRTRPPPRLRPPAPHPGRCLQRRRMRSRPTRHRHPVAEELLPAWRHRRISLPLPPPRRPSRPQERTSLQPAHRQLLLRGLRRPSSCRRPHRRCPRSPLGSLGLPRSRLPRCPCSPDTPWPRRSRPPLERRCRHRLRVSAGWRPASGAKGARQSRPRRCRSTGAIRRSPSREPCVSRADGRPTCRPIRSAFLTSHLCRVHPSCRPLGIAAACRRRRLGPPRRRQRSDHRPMLRRRHRCCWPASRSSVSWRPWSPAASFV